MAATLEVLEPATEQILDTIPRAGVAEVDAAVARARAAYPAWRAVAPGDRARLLRRVVEAMEGAHEELALLEARNAGKPIGVGPRRDRHGDRDVPLLRGRAGAPASARRSRSPAAWPSRSASRSASSG